jgi:molybdenum cofactor guanylyltransferase
LNQLLGIILCGGKSTRMGFDKGLHGKEKSWSKRQKELLESLDIKVKISINLSQIDLYKNHFNESELILDSENFLSPLNGILSTASLFPNSDLFILACDLQNMEVKIINQIFEAYKNSPEYDCYSYFEDLELNRFEPLCTIYKSKFLQTLDTKKESIFNSSLQNILFNAKTYRLKISESELMYFHNFNNQKDLSK